jgi:hypothetical protein
MPTAQLTFNLPEEREEFQDAVDAGKVKGALQEYDNKLRALVKYGGATPDEDVEWAQKARDLFHEVLEECGVEVW